MSTQQRLAPGGKRQSGSINLPADSGSGRDGGSRRLQRRSGLLSHSGQSPSCGRPGRQRRARCCCCCCCCGFWGRDCDRQHRHVEAGNETSHGAHPPASRWQQRRVYSAASVVYEERLVPHRGGVREERGRLYAGEGRLPIGGGTSMLK